MGALTLVGLTVWQLLRLGYVAASDPGVAPTTGSLLLAFTITVVWLLTVYWLAMGAWRRSVWGCPFEHLADTPAARRCPRHGLLPSDATGPDATGGRP